MKTINQFVSADTRFKIRHLLHENGGVNGVPAAKIFHEIEILFVVGRHVTDSGFQHLNINYCDLFDLLRDIKFFIENRHFTILFVRDPYGLLLYIIH